MSSARDLRESRRTSGSSDEQTKATGRSRGGEPMDGLGRPERAGVGFVRRWLELWLRELELAKAKEGRRRRGCEKGALG
jgi:hypothetical protein